MHIKRLRQPGKWVGSSYDAERGRSLLPLSLHTLLLGERDTHLYQHQTILTRGGFIYRTYDDGILDHAELTAFPPFSGVLCEYDEYARLQLRATWVLDWARYAYARLHCPGLRDLPPGAIPLSVRCLQLPSILNTPLQLVSIPPGVERLILDHAVDQTLDLHLLPRSLTKLALVRAFQIVAGDWPPALEELTLTSDQPLLPGCLPPVTALRITRYSHPLPPGVLPSSITRLAIALGALSCSC